MAVEEGRMVLWECQIDDLEGDLKVLTTKIVLTLLKMRHDKERLVIVAYDELIRKVKVKNA